MSAEASSLQQGIQPFYSFSSYIGLVMDIAMLSTHHHHHPNAILLAEAFPILAPPFASKIALKVAAKSDSN